jgi:hypothetical protein
MIGKEIMIIKTVKGLLWMLLIAALLVALLAAANRLPSLTQQGFARQYAGIEEAKRSLGLGPVPVPAYFPEGIAWPPSFVLAQKRPYEAVVMEFKKTGSMETALIVVQSTVRGEDARLQRITLSDVQQETRSPLKGGRSALLQVGTCDNGAHCSRMAWQDNGFYYSVLLMSSPFELTKIAESMVR